MKYWVQFQYDKIDACGSDSVFRLDGRWNTPRMHAEALKQAERLKKVQSYTHYKICWGESFFSPKYLSTSYPIK